MTADTPERPDMNDDDIRAYARSHALADDGRGPSAAVRANVLAAAREIAAESAARVAAEQVAPIAVTPVAPPVAEVGRRRAPAINLSSWRVRSGAALCAMLLVGMVSWRFDSAHRLSGGVQVALAELRLAEPPTAAAPAELPVPALSAASVPYAAPPPVVADPLDNGTLAKPAVVASARDKFTIVAQAEQQPVPAPRAAAPMMDARRALPASPAPVVADAAPPAPAAAEANVPAAAAKAVAEQPQAVTVTAPAPVQIITSGAMPPSVVQRRIALIPKPAPKPTPAPEAAPAPTIVAMAPAPAPAPAITATAAPPVDAAAIASADQARDNVDRLGFAGEAAKKASLQASLAGASARQSPPPLQAAAVRGDVEALKRLLADPATRVDATDAAGRTALLHAVLAQRAAAVRVLLAAGADPGRADPAGLTPRAAARVGASAEIAALLAAPSP